MAAKSGAAVPAPEWARALTEAGRADQAAGSGDPAPVLAEGSRSMNEGHAATPKASGLERAVSMPTARSEEARRDEEDVRDEASDDDGDGGDDAPRLRASTPRSNAWECTTRTTSTRTAFSCSCGRRRRYTCGSARGATLGVKIRMCSGVARGGVRDAVGLRRRASGARGAGRRGERGVLGRVRGGTVNRGSMTAEGRMTRCVARSFASVPYFVHVKREPIGARLFFSCAARNPPKLLVCVQTPCRRRAFLVPMNASGAHPRRPESPEALAGVGARDRSRRVDGRQRRTQDVSRCPSADGRKPAISTLTRGNRACRRCSWRCG